MAAKSASDAATKKKKEKESKDKKEKTAGSAKNKGDSKKKKTGSPDKSSDREKRSAPKVDPATSDDTGAAGTTQSPLPQPSQPSPPKAHDPDAIQLFRRYDRERAGYLTRLDFLQLLRDYAKSPPRPSAHPTHQSRRYGAVTRMPLSLTDSRGIPLGFERTGKNSEFEAGQLFERYDRDRAGTLSLEKFLEFFADFRPQLLVFVDELVYAVDQSLNLSPNAEQEPISTPAATSRKPELMDIEQRQPSLDHDPSRTGVSKGTPGSGKLEEPQSLVNEYQASLWELRRICMDELDQKRRHLLEAMNSLREAWAEQPNSRVKSRERVEPQPRRQYFSNECLIDDLYNLSVPLRFENQTREQYEEMRDDLDRMNGIKRLVHRQLRHGLNVTVAEMEQFVQDAPTIILQARRLVMKGYDASTIDPDTRNTAHDISRSARRWDIQLEGNGHRHTLATSQSERDEQPAVSSPKAKEPNSRRVQESDKSPRIKDQMIYQLLQERTSLRRDKAMIEASLQDLTEVTTQEMKKWAQLTDDMQAEIEHLRSELSRHNQVRATRR